MDESCGITSGWFPVGHIWWHTRGLEDAAVDAELTDVSADQVRMLVRTSWGVTDDVIIAKGSHETYQEPGGPVWRVYCDDVSQSMNSASIRICYMVDIPDPEVCSDYTTQAECNAAGCHWYGNTCHGDPEPEPKVCSDYTNQVDCESAGCKWEDGICKVSDVPPEPIPDDSTRMELNREVSLLGFGFKLSEVNCARGEAVVEYVGTGLRRVLVLGGASVMIPVVGAVVYMAAVWVNSECNEIAVRGMSSPEDPEQKGPDTDSGKTIDEMDEEKFAILEISLDPEDLTDITMEELKKRDIDAHKITQGDETKPDWATKEEWDTMVSYWEELMEDVAAGRISIEEAWALWDSKVVEIVADSFISDKFTLMAPGIVMANSEFTIHGRTPQKNMKIQIMAVRKYWGFDWAKTDKELAVVTSDEFFKYETKLMFEEFGNISVYARAPKEWYEIWKEDHNTDKVSVWVLTWPIVIAMMLAVGLILEKKYNKLGLFKR